MTNFETVETEYGSVRGIHKISALSTDYVSFQGIPYMKAPLGKLRFRDPEPPNKWNHVLDATEDSPSYCALNLVTRDKEGQENAATVNVFTKNIKPEKLYPVMVWIYGGGFIFGSCKTDLYGPDYLLQEDVILVSFNYRLGASGFLSLEDESLNIPGNAGLKDQIFALKWVQRNIENFGGDPQNVTLFGENCGGISVHLLAMSEQSRGLFRRAIIMSGPTFNKSFIYPRAYCKRFSERLARKLGWTGGDERDLLEFLEDAPASEISSQIYTLLSNEEMFADGIINPFGPVIEPYKSANCVIPNEPVEMAREAWSNDIDVIFTGTSFEGIMRANWKEEVAYYYLENPACFAPLINLDLQATDPIAVEYGHRIRDLYFEPDAIPSPENRENYLRFNSELLFWHAIYRAVLSRLEFARAKTYLLRFNVEGQMNLFKSLGKCEEYKGASHADDLLYLFKSIHLDVPPEDSKDFLAIRKTVKIFTNFAKDGDPNCEEIEPCKITPLKDANDLKCIEITEDDTFETELPELNKLEVWNSVYEDHDVPLF